MQFKIKKKFITKNYWKISNIQSLKK